MRDGVRDGVRTVLRQLFHTGWYAVHRRPGAGCWPAGLLLGAALVAGCGSGGDGGAARSGQTLASVNGEEITTLQLNDELQRANVASTQQEAASKQLLEALIDRQLLQNEAARERTDRDPKVVQAIERARALIIAQAHMQKKLSALPRPTSAEIADYYARHPEFFAQRKLFDLRQLVIDHKALTGQVTAVADNAGSLDEVAAWFDANKVPYQRAQSVRTTSDLAPDMAARLKTIARGQLFVVREGERSMIVAIADIKDSPVPLPLASAQIEKFLFTQKSKQAADAELQRLRALARIDYLNRPAGAVAFAASPVAARVAAQAAQGASVAGTPAAVPVQSAASPPPSPTPSTAASTAPVPGPGDAATARGVAGLK